VLSGLIADGLTGRQYSRDLWLGMLAPLAVVAISWWLTVRVHRTNPRKVTALMIGAFAGKLIFFGAYVALALVAFGVQPVPFALSLTGYFIVLHGIEALLLKRLFV
jgi:hypothetical protein